MVRRDVIDTYHKVLDLIEEAHKAIEKYDAPTAQHLFMAKGQLESVLARDIAANAREEWRNRPQAAPA